MGNYTIFLMFENPRTGRQARNFTTNDLDLKSACTPNKHIERTLLSSDYCYL